MKIIGKDFENKDHIVYITKDGIDYINLNNYAKHTKIEDHNIYVKNKKVQYIFFANRPFVKAKTLKLKIYPIDKDTVEIEEEI